jgi:hypothetical protein
VTSLAEQYRAERRSQSASMIYNEPAQRLAPVQIYDHTPPRSLADRAAAPVASKFEQKPGESDHGFIARLTPLTAHLAESLPADGLERVVASYNAAVERINGGVPSHQGLREQLESRHVGTGRGLLGRDEKEARGAGLTSPKCGQRSGWTSRSHTCTTTTSRGRVDAGTACLCRTTRPSVTSSTAVAEICAEAPCPMLTGIEISEGLILQHQGLISDDSVRIHLQLYREIAERVHARYRCETVRDQDGALMCSLVGVFAPIYQKLVPVNMIAAGMRQDVTVPGAWI